MSQEESPIKKVIKEASEKYKSRLDKDEEPKEVLGAFNVEES